MKTLVDYMGAEDFAVYQELQEKALAAKAANPGYMDAEGSDGLYPLYPRETTTIDTTKVPTPTWIKYLDEADQKTLMDILTRANEAMLVVRSLPKSDAETIQSKIANSQKKLAKLIEQFKAAGIEIEED